MKYLLAWSKDAAVRQYSSSGGFTRELLKFALVSGFVDKLVFVRMHKGRAEIVVTDDYHELMTPKANSAYYPCQSQLGLQDVPNDETCGVTVLPCGAETLDTEKAKLVVELMCAYVPKREWTEDILRRMGSSAATELIYRTGSWPGYTTVTDADGGSKHCIPFIKLWGNNVSTDGMPVCKVCSRQEIHGDVVVGDPWQLEPADFKRPGKTLVQVRSVDKIMPLIEEANIAYDEVSAAMYEKAVASRVRRKAGQ